jgi:PIN domain nuclease of toxin-antitoxin system
VNKKIVFDASTLLALLQEEKGCECIEKHLSHAIMSSVNFSEVISVLINAGINEKDALSHTTALIKEIVPFDSEQAYQAARLRTNTKKYGLSFGDRACIALGQLHKSTVLTADKIWSNLHLQDVKIEIIR